MNKDAQIPWDTMDPKKRDQLLLQEAIISTLFAKKAVPFYQSLYAKFSNSDIQNIASLAEFAHTIPETTRHHLIHNNHTAFLPLHHKKIKMNKATGGTTTEPIAICFTKKDIQLFAQATARSIAFDFPDIEALKKLKILGLYHGDHITNHFFRAAFDIFDIEFFDRISTKNLIEPNYHFFVRGSLNAVLGPPGGVAHKGISLNTFFEYDATYSSSHTLLKTDNKANVQAVFWSSAPLDPHLLDYMKNYLKIPYIKGIYGSTEAAPVGTTCQEHDHSFHVDYFPILTLVKTPDGLAKDGEQGHLLVSKVGMGENTGTVLINYRNGDLATIQEGTCPCGRNTPVLHRIKRVEDIQAQSVFGCEAD